jgi:2Fe-2S ferredoxin
MPTVTLIDFSGEPYTIEAETGKSLMENALQNGVPGIDADCGGACACGTCHCFVDAAWRDRTGTPSPQEDGMLSMRPDRAEGSRLSCQIEIREDLDGLVVRLPEFQM